jgi:hypothetical protein
MKTWWMGAWVWRISHCNYCVTLMHHMMHWPLPNWNFLVQEALIPPIGICQPREAYFCVDLSTSTSSKAFFCCRWGYRLIVSRNSVCASSPPATSIFTGMYNIATDHNHHVISRLYLPCRQRPNVIHNIPFGFHFGEICFPAENSEPAPILQALILSGPLEDEVHHHHGPCVASYFWFLLWSAVLKCIMQDQMAQITYSDRI